MILFISMLVLGDGLAPSAFIAFAAMAVYAAISAVERLDAMKSVQVRERYFYLYNKGAS